MLHSNISSPFIYVVRRQAVARNGIVLNVFSGIHTVRVYVCERVSECVRWCVWTVRRHNLFFGPSEKQENIAYLWNTSLVVSIVAPYIWPSSTEKSIGNSDLFLFFFSFSVRMVQVKQVNMLHSILISDFDGIIESICIRQCATASSGTGTGWNEQMKVRKIENKFQSITLSRLEWLWRTMVQLTSCDLKISSNHEIEMPNRMQSWVHSS